MPDPKNYKPSEKDKYMRDCMHQTMHVEHKTRNQGLGQCLNWWKSKHKKMAHKVAGLFIAKQSIRLFLDDLRNPHEYGLTNIIWVKNYTDAVKQIETGAVTWISFDHDLGEGKSGYDVAKYIEENVFHGKLTCPEWQIHSANPKGRKNIEMAMKSAQRFMSPVEATVSEIPQGLKNIIHTVNNKMRRHFHFEMPADVEWRTYNHPEFEIDKKQNNKEDDGGFITKDFKKIYINLDSFKNKSYEEFVAHEMGHFLDKYLGQGSYLSHKLDASYEVFAMMVDYVINNGHSGGAIQTKLYNAVCDAIGLTEKERVKPGLAIYKPKSSLDIKPHGS